MKSQLECVWGRLLYRLSYTKARQGCPRRRRRNRGGGGVITDWDGNAIDLSWQGHVVAAGDPDRHRDVLVLLAEGA